VTYAIAAAGTGGHVYPALAVAEALAARGVSRESILFVGGSRLEATAVPEAGFPFVGVELAGLQRRLTTANLAVPGVVLRAVRRLRTELAARGVRVMLGMGSYVTVPAGWAARRIGAALVLSEQNAEAGLANRVMSPFAVRVFGSFPRTRHLRAEWVGNPLRRPLARFDRGRLRAEAARRYGLRGDVPTLGVFGGSLGAGALNEAVGELVSTWSAGPLQVVHLAGRDHAARMGGGAGGGQVTWRIVEFEDRMDLFYAAVDLVVARAGGAVAELTATRTPAVLVPGSFGSGRHQRANAEVLEAAGAAVVLAEADLDRLGTVVAGLLADRDRLHRMAEAASTLARPDAADRIAEALEELHG